MRPSIALFCLLPFGPLAAQNSTVRTQLHWIYGDKRLAEVNNVVRFTTVDSVHVEMSSTNACVLEVTDVRKDHYELTVRSSPETGPLGSLDVRTDVVDTKMDSTAAAQRDLMKAVSPALQDVQLRFRISLQGEIKEVLNKDDGTNAVRDAMREGLNDMYTGLQRKHIERPSAGQLAHVADSIYAVFIAFRESMVNELLRSCRLDFPATGSVRQRTTVHQVDAALLPEWTDVPAMAELGLDENSADALVCRLVTTYDPAAVATHMVAAATADAKGLSLVEEDAQRVDKRGGWLTKADRSLTLRRNRQVIMESVTHTVVKTVK